MGTVLAYLIGGIIVGALAYAVVKIALLTFSILKDRIRKKLSQKPGTIRKGAVVSIQSVLESAPEISLEDFGPKVEENDYLIFGIKEDGTVDEDVDVIRAEKVDDQLSNTMDHYDGVIKITN